MGLRMSWYEQSDIYMPNLGLDIKKVPVGIQVFGIEISFYGIIVLLALVTAFIVIKRTCTAFSIKFDKYVEYALLALPLSVVGARLFYVVLQPESFYDNPLSILDINMNGMVLYGGIFTALIYAWFYCRLYKINFGTFTDTLIYGLLAGQIVGLTGNFFNRSGYGRYVNNTISMHIETNEQTMWVTPVFVYEMLACVVLLIVLCIYRKFARYNGEITHLYFLLYGLARVYLEIIRLDRIYIFNGWVTGVWCMAVLGMIWGASGILKESIRRSNKSK